MIFNFDIVPVSTEEAQKFGEKQALGIETNIANYQRKQNTNNNYTSIIPYDMDQQRKEFREFLAWPLSVQGTITSRFGTRADPITCVVKTHGGTDIPTASGTPILAAADGVVSYARYNEGGYGFYVKIQHNGTYSTLYGHCSVLNVTTG